MVHLVRLVTLVASILCLPAISTAGWIVEWQNRVVKTDGSRLDPVPSTMYIGTNRVRVEQPAVVTLIDYGRERFTILNPEAQYFWAGSLEAYLTDMTRDRVAAMREKVGDKSAQSYGMPIVDESSLPRIVIKRAAEKEEIAGHPTVKYTIESNGEVFQEIWLAEGLDLSRDLDPKKVLAYERRMSDAQLGASAGAFSALHRSEDYRKLLARGFVLRSIVRHNLGGFERTVTSIRPAEVSDDQFLVPESYRRVLLKDVLAAPGSNPAGR